MARIEPLSPPYAEPVDETFRRLMPEGMEPLLLFRTVAHNPRVLQRMQRGGLLDSGSITVRQRELAILRTTALLGAEYEWGVHAAVFGGQAQLAEAELEATAGAALEHAGWAEDERLILHLCDALHDRGTIDDALLSELAAKFTPAQLIELTMLVGLYHAVSFVVNVTGVEREPWARRFGVPMRSGSRPFDRE